MKTYREYDSNFFFNEQRFVMSYEWETMSDAQKLFLAMSPGSIMSPVQAYPQSFLVDIERAKQLIASLLISLDGQISNGVFIGIKLSGYNFYKVHYWMARSTYGSRKMAEDLADFNEVTYIGLVRSYTVFNFDQKFASQYSSLIR